MTEGTAVPGAPNLQDQHPSVISTANLAPHSPPSLGRKLSLIARAAPASRGPSFAQPQSSCWSAGLQRNQNSIALQHALIQRFSNQWPLRALPNIALH